MLPICVHALYGYYISSISFKCMILSFNIFLQVTFKECMSFIKCSMNAYVIMLHINCWTINKGIRIQTAKLFRK